MEKKKLVIIAGPTASGKTGISIELAKRIGGEIISADSVQVYKDMDIGSAKIRPEEMGGIKHHLIDVLEPTEEFNICIFQNMVKKAMQEIYDRGNIPILVGGTGFYIQSVLYDIDFDHQDTETDLRKELEREYDTKGADFMSEKLRLLDEASFEKIHKNNKKRLIRAIEYALLTGDKISEHNERERSKSSPYDFHFFVLHTDRQILYQNIEKRVDLMLEQGLVKEVESLRNRGLNRSFVSMQALGYKEILSYLDGESTLEEAIYILKRDTRHFAKRQITWFKREKDAIWIDVRENPLQEILGRLEYES